jgi:hypothetical protein
MYLKVWQVFSKVKGLKVKEVQLQRILRVVEGKIFVTET